MIETPKIEIYIDNIKTGTASAPTAAKYRVIIYRANGASELVGEVPIGDSIVITEEELAGN